ncbi:MAG: spore coat protein CotJB [Clostridia bacterium]|nr:spore coat protein CotJB [Clostridia bacterium]
MNGKWEALRAVSETGFVLQELIEYLDTHPADAQALSAYRQARDAYEAAKDYYVANYGPLCAENVPDGEMWDWVAQPWPWETEV